MSDNSVDSRINEQSTGEAAIEPQQSDVEPEPTVTVTQLMQQLGFARDKFQRETKALRERNYHLEAEFKEVAAQSERFRQGCVAAQKQTQLVAEAKDAEIERIEAESTDLMVRHSSACETSTRAQETWPTYRRS